MRSGDRLELRIEKPAAGGRMIARHDGAVILVSGAIPGEVVDAEVEKVQRGTIWARTVDVIEASTDRVAVDNDWACGGNVLSHVRYERQTDLKREIIRDALTRIGRMAPPDDIEVTPSPVDGYRMRARLHVVDRRIGFFREGTHQLCDPACTRQLLPSTIAALQQLEDVLNSITSSYVAEIELSENCAADQRAIHLVLHRNTDPSRLGSLRAIPQITGISCGTVETSRALELSGTPIVRDIIRVASVSGPIEVTIARHAHAFFQGNRFLLAPLVTAVSNVVPAGNVLDLYAGVGLFAASLAHRGDTRVVAIEGDATSARDLKNNAAGVGGALEASHHSVETFLSSRSRRFDTVIVDPPRTGMTKEALSGVVRLRAPRVVYVSCDVATLARDARLLLDGGYKLKMLRAFDLFPNTAHVESVAVFDSTQ
jgi:23S rRNA (uracil1939-C5)-methyltransferase